MGDALPCGGGVDVQADNALAAMPAEAAISKWRRLNWPDVVFVDVTVAPFCNRRRQGASSPSHPSRAAERPGHGCISDPGMPDESRGMILAPIQTDC